MALLLLIWLKCGENTFVGQEKILYIIVSILLILNSKRTSGHAQDKYIIVHVYISLTAINIVWKEGCVHKMSRGINHCMFPVVPYVIIWSKQHAQKHVHTEKNRCIKNAHMHALGCFSTPRLLNKPASWCSPDCYIYHVASVENPK